MSEIDFKQYGLGAIKDKYDPRDYIYQEPTAVNTSYPVGYELHRVPIKNQGAINSCVAHSIATIKEIQEYYETGQYTPFSVGWIYGYRLSNQFHGLGMYPKEALANLKNIGDVQQEDFPENFEYNEIQYLVTNRKSECIEKAAKYKVSSYARVTSVLSVKSCIYDKHSPVMIVCDIYDSFYRTGADGKVPLKSGALQGSHAMTIVGWTKINGAEYFVVQNSWGTEWGDSGYCYIRTNSDIITDMYTLVDKDNIVINFTDVDKERWSKAAIDKCVKAGLISGFPDGTFRPADTISREQICQMFARMLDK